MTKGKIQKTPTESPKPKTAGHRVKAAKPVPELVDIKTATKKKVTAKHSQNPAKMEVHHHPELDHKKSWKEYLLEGVMIFIAVMMGFIAENIREAIDNHEHVKQLTSQLAQELKKDTTKLDTIIFKETEIARSNTLLINLLQQPLQKADTRQIQKQITNSHNLWPFHPSTEAMAAIKNELHLKQFSNSEIISHFAQYEGAIELLHTAQDVSLQYQRLYLDQFLTQHFTPANMVSAFDEHGVPNGQMRNLTQTDLDQLAVNVVLIRIVTQEMIRDNKQAKDSAVALLKYVTKQYNL